MRILFVLFALAEGEKHGYAIMQDTVRLSGGSFRTGPATLYTTIQRLLEQGLIRETAGADGADSRRRYYGITPEGRSLVAMEVGRIESVVRRAAAMRLREAESE